MSGPLEGIKVIDCGVYQAGPTAATILGDLGADVIKVEPCVSGDPGRFIEVLFLSTHGMHPGQIPKGVGEFEIWNRNKRSITLDLAKEKGREVFYRLVGTADVMINNWRTGVAERLKVDYETLLQYNPKIVYGHISGWGTKGPESEEPALDFAAIARSGMAYQAGKSNDPPVLFVSGYADTTGGIILSQGILAALVARERQQVGEKVEVSLLGSLVAGLERLPVSTKAQSGLDMLRKDRAEIDNPLWNYYKCQDGKWISVAMAESDRYWSPFCKALSISEIENDPRFSNREARSKNTQALFHMLEEAFAKKPQEEWLRILRQYKLIYAPIQTIGDLLSDPQVLENQYVFNYDHPVHGPIKVAGFPWNFSKMVLDIRLPAPEIGQHTEEILRELGYSHQDILDFKGQKII